jgi:uncharacterized protein (TIGR02594 family)
MNDYFIEAAFDTTTKAVQYKTKDGRILVRSGGSLCWRTNNCGNLASPVADGRPTPKKTKNYIGFAKVQNPEEHYFFIFPTYEEGREQLRQSITRKHAERTIPELMEKYAPKHENDTQKYTDFVVKKTGLLPSTKVAAMSTPDVESIIDAIEEMEGYNHHKDSQREDWVTVSQMATSDGVKPIPGATIQLNQDGRKTIVAANELGKFPPLIHPKLGQPPIEIEVPTKDGLWKKIFSLTHQSKPRTGIFLLDLLAVSAPMLSHVAPSNAKTQKIPVHYRVKPGDTLEKIAAANRSTSDEIKKLNGLSSRTLHPEQMLWIHVKGVSKAKPASSNIATRKTPLKPQKEKEKTEASAKKTIAPTKGLHGNILDWITPAHAELARSKDGEGAPLALINLDEKRAPWMKVAIDEAKKFHGMKEDNIEKSINFPVELKTGMKTMIGDKNPWCAAFANWCLKQAGYPTDAGTIWASRANAFLQHTTGSINPKATYNPLFKIIDEPIYGAIAVEGKPNRGHHVGFVYGKDGDNIIILGGNQSNTINCIPKAKSKIWFLIPASYATQAENDLKETKLVTVKSVAANKEIGLPDVQANHANENSSTL